MTTLPKLAKSYGIRLRKKADIIHALNTRFKTWERSVLVTDVFEETIVHLYSESFEANCMKTVKSIASSLNIEISKESRSEIMRAFNLYFELNKPAKVRRVQVAKKSTKKNEKVVPIATVIEQNVVKAVPVEPVKTSVPIKPEQKPTYLPADVETPSHLECRIFHGVRWYKPSTKDGGAQAFLLPLVKPYKENNDGFNEIMIKSVTKSNGHMWAIVTEKQLRVLVEKVNFGINEVLHRFPHKVCFDFDQKGRDETFLDRIIPEIEKVFPLADMSISGSIRDEKTSYHITLNNWVITSPEERAAMKLIKIEAIDPCVYNTNHAMKCVNQSKPTDDRIQAIVKDDHVCGHLITAYLPFDGRSVSQSTVMQDYLAQQPINLAVIPKVVSTKQLNLDAMDARAIMNATPLSPENDFVYANRVLRFVRANGISFEEFLVWAHQKHEDDKKWLYQWKNERFAAPSMESMKATLKHMYPNAVKTEDLSFVKFRDTFDIGETVKVDRLGQEHFKEGITCINIGMGGGKTTQTIDWVKDKNYVVISPNIALGRNMTSRLPKASFYKDIKTRTSGIKEKQLIICMNSLHYVTESYDTVVLDEIETVLNKWQGTFMKDKKEPNFSVFVKLIREAKNIILLDAFLTTKTLDFIRSIRSDPITIIQRKEEPKTKTVHYVSKFQSMVARIMDDLSNGKKVFIFYPQKGQTSNISMAGLHKLLSESGKKGVFYNSEIDEDKKKDLRDVNASWQEMDFVITNTTITVGINYDNEVIFDSTYLFMACYNMPRDVIQVSCRPRTLRSGMIYAHFMGKMTKNEVWLNDCAGMPDEFTPLFKNNLIELSAPVRKTFGLFCEHAGYKQVANAEDMYEHQIEKVRKLLDEHAMFYDFSSIPDITFETAEAYQMKIFDTTATQLEKITLTKYLFVTKFRKDMRNDKLVANAWNWQRIKLTDAIYSSRSLFTEIAEHNGFVGLPDLVKVKLSPELIERIFSEFTFRSLTRKSSIPKILFNIYNDHFGPIYKSVEISPGNRVYMLDDGIQEYYKFCLPAMQRMVCTCKNCHMNDLGMCKICSGIKALK
jgi:hypothetical protein